MVKQYPDILTATIIGPSTTDGNGNPVPGAPTEVVQECRAETPNVQVNYIQGEDGKSIYFSWVVYMPHGAIRLPVGAKVVITRGGEFYCSGNVKKFVSGQMNARLWL